MSRQMDKKIVSLYFDALTELFEKASEDNYAPEFILALAGSVGYMAFMAEEPSGALDAIFKEAKDQLKNNLEDIPVDGQIH